MRGPARMFAAALLASAACSGAACSLLIDADAPQCETDADCTARGAAFAGAVCTNRVCGPYDGRDAAGALGDALGGDVQTDTSSSSSSGDAPSDGPPVDVFACVGERPVPTPVLPTSKLTLTFTDLLNDGPVTSIKVSVCPNLTDPACTSPTATAMPDSKGVVTFNLDTSTKAFDGYIDVDPITPDGGAADRTGTDQTVYVPSRIYYAAAPLAADKLDDSFVLLTFSALNLFATLFGQTYDKTAGSMFLIAQDCLAQDAAGVSFLVDTTGATTHSFYLKNDQPSISATATDISGTGGFLNIPPGAPTFTMQDAVTRKNLGTLTGYIRPNTISYAHFGPAFKQ